MLVGQTVVIDFTMTISTLEETVTVTGAAPLVDVQQSSMGGNVDTRQLEALPVNGRSWMQLTTLAPGSRVNSAQTSDSPSGLWATDFQVNLDGQPVSQTFSLAQLGQPRFSRDAIAEFEVVSSRFDATQGRSTGIQVNAVTKSGTNMFAGSLAGYFRHDSMNAADFFADEVLPYSNQQISGTFGGPIVRDRLHFFGYYEHEREPRSYFFQSGIPEFDALGNGPNNDGSAVHAAKQVVRRARGRPAQRFDAPDGARQRMAAKPAPQTGTGAYEPPLDAHGTELRFAADLRDADNTRPIARSTRSRSA